MRIFDLAGIAVKSLKGRWAVLPALAAAIGVFCLCFAGTALAAVQQEKSKPYEISVTSADSKLTESDVADIAKLNDVKAATPVLSVPVLVTAGDYSAELELTGVYASYLSETFKSGGVFPESSVMPYIVLNDAALKQFKSQKDESRYEYDNGGMDESETETKAPDVNWLNENVSIQAGEGNPVTSKICGILSAEGEDEQSAAYISISAAKALLPPGGQQYAGAGVRVANIGSAERVSRDITALGLSAGNVNAELQSKWDNQESQTTYLFITGGFSLLCFTVLMASLKKISLLERKEEWRSLRWIGFREKDIGKIFVIQMLALSVIGMLTGILVSTSLPSFLDPDPTGASIYTLPVPFWIAAVSGAVFIAAGLFPALTVTKSVSSELG